MQWLWRHPNFDAENSFWYIDGSMFDGDVYDFISTGFGIAAVSPSGALMALGHGVPPSWINSASGAELWALYIVLSLCAQPPRVTTDCMALLIGLQAAATSHAPPADRRRERGRWCFPSSTIRIRSPAP